MISILPLILVVLPALQPSLTTQNLVATEWAFAQDAETHGIRDAFLGVMHPQGVLFRPTPVNGRTWLEHQKDLSGRLKWYPTLARTAASADLGFTTGPYTFQEREDAPLHHGWFVSLWIRENNGPWRLLLDGGCPGPAPETDAPPLRVKGSKGLLPRGGKLRPLTSEILALDQEPPDRHWSPESRLYRPGNPPQTGKRALEALASELPASMERQGGWGSSAGDMACTYGLLKREGSSEPLRCPYLRIWIRNGGVWFLLVDLQGSPL